jgi:hypothetical protein
MSSYPTDEPVYPATTPVYEEEVIVTTAEVPQGTGSSGSGRTSQATDQAKQTAGQAKETVKQTASEVKGQAADVAETAKGAGQQVASTTKDEAQRVVSDTVTQARQLLGQATTELSSQAGKQQERLGGGIRTFGHDLSKLGRGEQVDSGPASELVQNLSQRAHRVADWLEARSPEEVLDEVRQYAARRPGLFIAIAAGAGVVAARLTKALVADAKSNQAGGTSTVATGYQSRIGYADTSSTYVGGTGDTYVAPTGTGTGYGTGTGVGTGTEYDTGLGSGNVGGVR